MMCGKSQKKGVAYVTSEDSVFSTTGEEATDTSTVVSDDRARTVTGRVPTINETCFTKKLRISFRCECIINFVCDDYSR